MTNEERKILDDYTALMREVRERLQRAQALIHEPQAFPEGMVKEFCYLQIRMICELIALGCLIAHGGLKGAQTNYLRKTYAADKIVAELEKLHQHFFPQAVSIQTGPDGKLSGISDAPDGYLTKAELIELYGLCGAVLHRGNIQRFLSGKPIPKSDKRMTARWINKLALLEHHTIVLSGMNKAILCRIGAASRLPTTALFMVAQ